MASSALPQMAFNGPPYVMGKRYDDTLSHFGQFPVLFERIHQSAAVISSLRRMSLCMTRWDMISRTMQR